MTNAEELTLLETAYEGWIRAGCPQSYSMDGRSVTKVNAEFFTKRISELRTAVSRETSGMFFASQFRAPE